MKNKLIASLAVLTIAGAASVKAQDELSISATIGWESEYVFRGLQLAKTSFQNSIDLSYGGAYLGLWTMLPVDGVEGFAKEFDVYAGYGFAATDMINLDVGVTLYYYPSIRDIFAMADRTTFEAYIGGSLNTMLSPSLYLYYDFTLENWVIEGSIGHSLELAEATSLDLGLHSGYVFVHQAKDYWYGGISADIGYAFTDNAKASLGTRLTFNDEKAYNSGKSANLWWGMSFSAGF